MQVVIAPDSFKGSLDAAGAARAIAEGWRAERPRDELVVLPQADGGEGTLDAIEVDEGDRQAAVQRNHIADVDPGVDPRESALGDGTDEIFGRWLTAARGFEPAVTEEVAGGELHRV